MAEEVKEVKFSDAEMAALAVLKEHQNISLADINTFSTVPVKTGTMTHLMRKGKIAAEKTEVICPDCGAKRSFNLYHLI